MENRVEIPEINENPKISIIIPAYNVEDYIKETVDCLRAQTYKNLEIIAVDDGSTDGTGKMLDGFSKEDGRIKVIHKENGGAADARIRGVRESAGDYIGFIDGDDTVEPYFLEKLLSNALKYGADISHCGYQIKTPSGNTLYFHNTGVLKVWDADESLNELLSGELVEPGLWTKLFKRELFNEIISKDIIDVSIKINEDLLMNFFVFKNAKKTAFEDITPYHYRMRETSATHEKFSVKKAFDPLKVRKIILDNVTPAARGAALKSYYATLIYTYSALDANMGETPEKSAIRREIIDKSFLLKELNGKLKLGGFLIIKSPRIYSKAYKLYLKYFHKNIYE